MGSKNLVTLSFKRKNTCIVICLQECCEQQISARRIQQKQFRIVCSSQCALSKRSLFFRLPRAFKLLSSYIFLEKVCSLTHSHFSQELSTVGGAAMTGGLEENAIMIVEDPRLELIRKGFSLSLTLISSRRFLSKDILLADFCWRVCINFGIAL